MLPVCDERSAVSPRRCPESPAGCQDVSEVSPVISCPQALQPLLNPGLNHVPVWQDDDKEKLVHRSLDRVGK